MSRFEPVDRIVCRRQRRYKRLGMGIVRRPTPPRWGRRRQLGAPSSLRGHLAAFQGWNGHRRTLLPARANISLPSVLTYCPQMK